MEAVKRKQDRQDWMTIKAVFEMTKPVSLPDLSGGFQKVVLLSDKGSIEVESGHLSFLFYKTLVHHKIRRVEEKDIDVRFAATELLYFFRNFESDIGMYLEKGKRYYIEKVNYIEPSKKDPVTIVHTLFKEYGAEKPKEVNLYLAFRSGEEAYARRAFNFFNDRIADPSRFQITPIANLSSVIDTRDLNELFMCIDSENIMIRKGEVYRLTDVGLNGDTVFIRYSDKEGNDLIYRIEGYGADSGEEARRAKSIYNYFRRNIETGYSFFVSAVDITNNMLDYMIADPHGELAPRVFRFAKEDEGAQAFNFPSWNTIRRADFGGISIKFFPNRVP
ncbi:MAG: hypothetical protein QXR29_02565 [Candidatus Micrarchaeaceae archaeon]